MTDLISRAMFNNENLVERKLKSCYINCEEEKDMNNFDILQEYEKASVPLPRLEDVESLKNKIKLLKTALKYSISTAKVALDFIQKNESSLSQVKLIMTMEEMINDTQDLLK